MGKEHVHLSQASSGCLLLESGPLTLRQNLIEREGETVSDDEASYILRQTPSSEGKQPADMMRE